MDIISIVVSLVVTTISLLIISKFPAPFKIIEIDSIQKSFLAAIVFGILNAVLHFAFGWLEFLTFGLAALIINIIIFGLAALLIQGFRLRSKIFSPIIGALALSVINSIIFKLVGQFIETST